MSASEQEIAIRSVQPGDEEHVRGLITAIMADEFPGQSPAYNYQDLDRLSSHYGGSRETFLVAEKDGEIVGTAGIKEESPEVALLRRVFVKSGHRRKGYGAGLIEAALSFCRRQGYSRVVFRGTDRMHTALGLCLKNGFLKKEIVPFGDFDLVVLARDLGDGGRQ